MPKHSSQIQRDEHDENLNAKKVSLTSAATIYAVVNTSGGGAANEVSVVGNVTIDSGNINVTDIEDGAGDSVMDAANNAIRANIVAGGAGVTTIYQGPGGQASNPWDVSVVGNVTVSEATLADSIAKVGFATVHIGGGSSSGTEYTEGNTDASITGKAIMWEDTADTLRTVSASKPLPVDLGSNNDVTFSGNVTVESISSALPAGDNNIGNVDIASNTAWSDPNTFIGLSTVVQSNTNRSIVGNVTVQQGDDPWNVAVKGNVTISDSKAYIGLVTAETVNGGTNKTLIHKNIELSTSSVSTIYVPTNTFKITNLLISSNATVRMSIKSGATYLTGNASIGVTINPGGGWVETGSPDSPTYIGLADAAAIVFEKFDMTGTAANVGGKVVFFEE